MQGDGSATGSLNDFFPKPVKELGIRDVLPEIPVTDVSAFEYRYDNDLGGICITDYNGQALKVRIPDTIEGEPIVGVNLSNCYEELIELIMPDSVKKFSLSYSTERSLKYLNIPGAAQSYPSFKDQNLESVYISNGVTEIGRENFKKCESLTNVAIPGSVTKTYGFDGCTSLTSVIISNGVTMVGGFNNCTSLTSVTIPDSVTEIYSGTFKDCTSLTSVEYKGKIYDGESASGMFIFGKTFEVYKVEFDGNVLIYKDYPYEDLPYITISFLSDEKCEMTFSQGGETMTQELQYTLQRQSVIITGGGELQIVNGRELSWDVPADDENMVFYFE